MPPSAGPAYSLLLALWSDEWVAGSASATVSLSLSLSFSHSHSHDGGHGHHHHHHWLDNRHHYERARDDYWAAREEMLRRHIPLEPAHVHAEEPQMPEVVELARKHDRLLLQAEQIFDLPNLEALVRMLDSLSTQISDIQLQSEDEALCALLLC